MRKLIPLFCLSVALTGGGRVPTDISQLNRVASEYNKYVEELQAGVVDVKQWEKVQKAWRGLGTK